MAAPERMRGMPDPLTLTALSPPGGRLRVGPIGAGDIAGYHLPAWQKTARAQVVAVCDRELERAHARAAIFDIPQVFDDAAAMLGAVQLDAVDIATWRDSHVALVRLAATHGRHVLCQKPLAPDLAQAEALVAEVSGTIRLMVHENRRFAPQFRTIGRWLRKGRLGELRQAHMIMHRSGYLQGPDGQRPALERAPRMASERRLLIAETLIHQLDVLRWLIGPLRVLSARTLHTEPDMPGETLTTIMMETERGAPVVLSGSFVAPGFGAAVSDRLELIGSRSSIILDGDRLEIRGQITKEQRFDMRQAYQPCFDEAIAHFAGCLLDGRAFESEAHDNLATLKLVEDAYAATAAR
jgi:predicted dehydrogenase